MLAANLELQAVLNQQGGKQVLPGKRGQHLLLLLGGVSVLTFVVQLCVPSSVVQKKQHYGRLGEDEEDEDGLAGLFNSELGW